MEIEHAQGAPFAISSMFDRIDHPARGRDGGGPGATGTIGLKSGRAFKCKGRQTIPPTERLLLQMPGGGGLGDAKLRAPARVARDVANGFVSVQQARADYGVVVDAEGSVDPAATKSLRGG